MLYIKCVVTSLADFCHSEYFLQLGLGALGDVCCIITILSGSLLEMLDFSFEAFIVTNELCSWDRHRKNSMLSATSDGPYVSMPYDILPAST